MAKKALLVLTLCLALGAIFAPGSPCAEVVVSPGYGVELIYSGPPMQAAEQMAITPDGLTMFVGDDGSQELAVDGYVLKLDLATRTMSPFLTSAMQPEGIFMGDGRPLTGYDLVVMDPNGCVDWNCWGTVIRYNTLDAADSTLLGTGLYPYGMDPRCMAPGPGGEWGDGIYLADNQNFPDAGPTLFLSRILSDGTHELFATDPGGWEDTHPTRMAFDKNGVFDPAGEGKVNLFLSTWKGSGTDGIRGIWCITSAGEATLVVDLGDDQSARDIEFGPGGPDFGTDIYLFGRIGGTDGIHRISPEGVHTLVAAVGGNFWGYPDLLFSADGSTLYMSYADSIYAFRREPECTNADADGDGVIDPWDMCPDTPEGSYVNSQGCVQASGGGLDIQSLRITGWKHFDLTSISLAGVIDLPSLSLPAEGPLQSKTTFTLYGAMPDGSDLVVSSEDQLNVRDLPPKVLITK